MFGIVKINVEWIIKDGLRLVKGNSVLSKICRSLCFIPLKSHGSILAPFLEYLSAPPENLTTAPAKRRP